MGAVQGSLPAVNFGTTSSGSLLGDVNPLMSLYSAGAQGGTNPAADVQAAGAAAKLGGQAATAAGDTGAASGLSSVSQAMPLVGGGVTIGMMQNSILNPPTLPDTANTASVKAAGMTESQLPSGNTMVDNKGIGIGLGSAETKGSGQIYNTNASGAPQWIGQANSDALEKAFDAYKQAAGGVQTGESVAAYDAANTTTKKVMGVNVSSNPGTGTAAQAAAATAKVQMTPAEITAGKAAATSTIDSIYKSTGGAAAWGGMTAEQFTTSLGDLLGQVGQGDYFGGNYHGI